MKFFWFGVVLLAFCFVCEVLSDFSDSILPSKEIRNRAQRTMRVNMRVGKRYGDSNIDDEAPKRRLRLVPRIGKRTLNDFDSPETHYIDAQYDTDPYDTNLPSDDSYEVGKRDFVSPNRMLVLPWFRHGKRNSEQAQLYGPKRRFYKFLHTGKRSSQDTLFTQIPNTQFNTEPTDDTVPDPNSKTDYKRSAPQFLLNPRVGKNDKTWKIRPLNNLQKRSDPKATDLWFGPRLGRSNDEQFEDIPWSYIVLNGNRLSNSPVFKSNELEEQPNEETAD